MSAREHNQHGRSEDFRDHHGDAGTQCAVAEGQRADNTASPEQLGNEVDDRQFVDRAAGMQHGDQQRIGVAQDLRHAERGNQLHHVGRLPRGTEGDHGDRHDRDVEREAREECPAEKLRGVLWSERHLFADVRIEAERGEHEDGRRERIGELKVAELHRSQHPRQDHADAERNQPGAEERNAEFASNP